MKKYAGFAALLLCLVLLVSLIPSAALAAGPASGSEKDENTEKAEPEKNEDKDSADPDGKDKKDSGGSDASEYIYVDAEKEFYAEPDTTVFNNGGTVYNNGALVYNNGGLCYNNLGTCYNNGGTVYANGGEVFDNNGTVHSYGGEIHRHDGKDESAEEDGTEKPSFRVELKDDYSGMVKFSKDAEDGILTLSGGEDCSFRAEEGYAVTDTDISSGSISLEDDGSYTVHDVEEDASLSISLKLQMPETKLRSGVYTSEQTLKFKVPEKAEIFYTTDGSDPTEDSFKYEDEIKINKGCTVKAAAFADGAGTSDICTLSFNIIKITVPGFASEKEGYDKIRAEAIKIKNPGGLSLKVKGMSISGDDADAFVLSTEDGHKIPADSEDETTWSLRPASDLKKGSYSARLCIEFENGGSAEFELSFTVK